MMAWLKANPWFSDGLGPVLLTLFVTWLTWLWRRYHARQRSGSRTTVAQGDRSIAIGGTVTDSTVKTGDHIQQEAGEDHPGRGS
jgi:hypothetical protein